MVNQIFVIFNNRTIVVEYSLNEYIGSIIDRIKKKIKIPVEDVYLTYCSKVLKNIHTLKYYNIKHNSSLQLHIRNTQLSNSSPSLRSSLI